MALRIASIRFRVMTIRYTTVRSQARLLFLACKITYFKRISLDTHSQLDVKFHL